MSLSSANVSNAATPTLSPQKHSTNEVCKCRQMEMEELACYLLLFAYNWARRCVNDFSSDLFAVWLGCFFNEFSPRKSPSIRRVTMKKKWYDHRKLSPRAWLKVAIKETVAEAVNFYYCTLHSGSVFHFNFRADVIVLGNNFLYFVRIICRRSSRTICNNCRRRHVPRPSSSSASKAWATKLR